jgi:2-polyprenyl-6-methoxyphenol hydroxylase-like FAD-dependent oxidoreductase
MVAGGLLAARVLQLGGVSVTVYDADASLESRDQGGTLDLHADSGRIAIDEAHLTRCSATLPT